MSFFRQLFSSAAERQRSKLLEIAAELGIESRYAFIDAQQPDTLEARWNGATLHLRYAEGSVGTCALRHACLDGSFDLEYDAEQKRRSVYPLPLVDAAKERGTGKVHVGSGVFCEHEDLAKFAKLPEELRRRLANELDKSNAVRFRARADELEVVFSHDTERQTSPKHIVRALNLAMEVCKVRGLRDESAGRWTKATPLESAESFSKLLPGSTVEDLSTVDFSGIWARVSFVHLGMPLRLVFYRFDEFTCNVWLETTVAGKQGSFGLMRWDSDTPPLAEVPGIGDGCHQAADDDDTSERGDNDDETLPRQRHFLSQSCYLEGTRVSSEVACFSSLSHTARQRALRLCTEYQALVLANEVLALNLGDHLFFVERTRGNDTQVPFPLAAGTELVELARALPLVDLSEPGLPYFRHSGR